jgi:ligand-binding SRPBCC domain-containing protein
MRTFRTTLRVAAGRERVFSFFANAENLDRLTPPWLGFEITTPQPIEMRLGTRLDYRLRLHGLPIRWSSEITLWEPPSAFKDVQRRGPHRRWEHLHTFEESDGGTNVIDEVEYEIPGGPLAPLADAWLVRPDLRRIFGYRHAVLTRVFGGRGQDLTPSSIRTGVS